MTKYDVEQRLRQAAAELPQPEGSLNVVEPAPARRRCPAAYIAAAVIVIALLVPAAVAIYGGGLTARTVGTSLTRVEEYGFRYPDALGEYAVISNVKCSRAQGTEVSAAGADYEWISMEYVRDEFCALLLTVGNMEQTGWYERFEFDLDTKKAAPEDTYPKEIGVSYEWKNQETVEYKGCEIYLYDRVAYCRSELLPISGWCDAAAKWVDTEAGLVFQIEWGGLVAGGSGEGGEPIWIRSYQMLTQEELLDYVKLIIDAQR